MNLIIYEITVPSLNTKNANKAYQFNKRETDAFTFNAKGEGLCVMHIHSLTIKDPLKFICRLIFG